jgi:4-hydroxybenzoate polyprenyltransferase
MLDFIKRNIDQIENSNFTITTWLLGFSGIFLIRYLLESFSSRVQDGVFPFDLSAILHVAIFFLTVIVGTISIIIFVSGENKVYKTVLFGLPIIWIAPIIDIVLSGGRGLLMTYIRDTHLNLLFDYFTFFGTDLNNGATIGMRIEIACILFFVGLYTHLKGHNIKKIALSVFLVYTFGFIIASLPGTIFTLNNLAVGSQPAQKVILYFSNLIFTSNLYHNTPYIINQNWIKSFEIGFDRLMSQILFLITIILSYYTLKKINAKKFTSIIKNVRTERLNFYTLSILSGAGYALITKHGITPHLIDFLGLTCLIVSWVGLWMQAVHQNDIEDIEIDKISNKNRPLVKNELSINEMADTRNLWLVIGIIGAFLAGFYPFIMSIIYIATSYIYSCPPLRLRRYPIIPSFLIGIACLATILAGFFFISVDKGTQNFPVNLALGIVLIVSLAINFKDLKDVEGDKANNILTLPIIFGRYGSSAVGICMALSILLVPLVLSFNFLFIFAIPISIASYYVCIQKPFKEKHIFGLRFIFLFCIALSYIIKYIN